MQPAAAVPPFGVPYRRGPPHHAELGPVQPPHGGRQRLAQVAEATVRVSRARATAQHRAQRVVTQAQSFHGAVVPKQAGGHQDFLRVPKAVGKVQDLTDDGKQ